jgi:choline kinase
MMQYIIMCGGKYDAWGTPRQLIEINGEPIVMRTIRLLRNAGAENIAISSNDDRFEACGVPLLRHDNGFVVHQDDVEGTWADAFYPSDDPVCYIFGDVVFSPEAIRTIVNTQTDSIQFFASAPPFDPKYFKPWAEPFAFKVVDQQAFKEAVEFVRQNSRAAFFDRLPISWELWQVIRHKPFNEIDHTSYIAINDYTCDIDFPEDIERIREALNGNNDPCMPVSDVVCE